MIVQKSSLWFIVLALGVTCLTLLETQLGAMQVFDQFKKQGASEQEEGPLCGVCYEQKALYLWGAPDCCHSFCLGCVHDWEQKSLKCPMCQRKKPQAGHGPLTYGPVSVAGPSSLQGGFQYGTFVALPAPQQSTVTKSTPLAALMTTGVIVCIGAYALSMPPVRAACKQAGAQAHKSIARILKFLQVGKQ